MFPKIFSRSFHTLIIATLLFAFAGCGKKGPPVYAQSENSDIDVTLISKNSLTTNNKLRITNLQDTQL